jgi:hypothetical protein
MKVSFDGGRLNERGVAVAIYDYAFHARRLWGVMPIILHDASGPVEADPVARFAAAFPTLAYRSAAERQALVNESGVEVAYVLKTMRSRYPDFACARTAVHEVFGFFDPHGGAYGYISSWLAEAAAAGRYPAVPHIVDPPSPRGDLRAEFGVPANALVVGRHGAPDQFNLPFLREAIAAALAARPDLWIMLLNTERFLEHERVVHLPRTLDRQRVSDFVASCDLGLNGRRSGESFGLAVAEYLAQDKPVLVWEGGRDRHHLALVDDSAFRYRTRADLTQRLLRFEPRPWGGRWRARVAPFAPEPVMADFARVFLAPGEQAKPRLPPAFRLRARAKERWLRWRDAQWVKA